jgi:hypothetical protein
VVLSEPLKGELREGIIIGGIALQERSEASSMWGINAERLRPPAGRQAQGFSKDHTDPPSGYLQPEGLQKQITLQE